MFSFYGDIVLDPFCGTATTLVAAMRSERNSIGVEIDPAYCRMGARRLLKENQSLFANAKLVFEKAVPTPQGGFVLREEEEPYQRWGRN